MNTLQMYYFLSVAEHQSFSKASEINYVSQPTLSKHIKNMEAELQTKLFDRTKNPIELTSMGAIYYKLIYDFMNDLNRIKNSTRKENSAYEGTLTIGILSGFNVPESLMDKFIQLQQQFPKTEFIFENHNVKDLIEKLKNGTLDTCLILADFVSEIHNIEHQILFDVPKYLVYSEKILSKPDDTPVTMKDFQNEIFFCLGAENSDPTRKFILEYCRHYDLYPTIKSIPNMESVMSNVAFGKGVTILDGLTQYNEAPHVKKLEIHPCHKLCLAWPSTNNHNPLVKLLREQILF